MTVCGYDGRGALNSSTGGDSGKPMRGPLPDQGHISLRQQWAETAHCSWQVRALLEHIHKEVFSPTLSVKTIRAGCNLRDHNVSSRFKREVGVSMRQYIRRLRLEAALMMLESGGTATAFEVGYRVGFGSTQTFYRLFQGHYQCSPGRARRAPIQQRSE